MYMFFGCCVYYTFLYTVEYLYADYNTCRNLLKLDDVVKTFAKRRCLVQTPRDCEKLLNILLFPRRLKIIRVQSVSVGQNRTQIMKYLLFFLDGNTTSPITKKYCQTILFQGFVFVIEARASRNQC